MKIRHGTAAVSGDKPSHVVATGRKRLGRRGGKGDPQVRRPGSDISLTLDPASERLIGVADLLNYSTSESGQKDNFLENYP